MNEYNAKDDGEASYLAAIEAKKARGDDYYLLPHEDLRLNSSSLEGATSLVRRDPSIQCIDKSLSSPLTSRAMGGPSIGHKDFCCEFQGSDVLDGPLVQNLNCGAEPSAPRHGGEA